MPWPIAIRSPISSSRSCKPPRRPDGENPKLSYKQVALGPYLHGLLREASHSGYDDAARANTMVVSWQPDFPYGRQDLERVQRGRHSAPGHGVLYVFTLVGRGPYKEETVEVASSVSLLIADRILSCTGKHTLPPTIAPIKVPKVVTPGNEVSHVRVSVDRRPAGDTATITDVGRMAVEQYEAIYPHVIAEAVVRRVVKKGIIYGAKEMTGVDRRSPASLALDLAGVAWEATEAADTRCWGLLPDKIQVLRVELPAGPHEIALQAIGCYRLAGPRGIGARADPRRAEHLSLGQFPSDAARRTDCGWTEALALAFAPGTLVRHAHRDPRHRKVVVQFQAPVRRKRGNLIYS